MFCPRCSQERTSENLRFCSSCGLSLDLVSAVVETGGNPERLLDQTQNKTLLTRRNGFLASLLWFLFFIVFLLPFLLIDGVEEELFVLIAVVGILGSIFLAVVSLFLSKSKEKLEGNPFTSGRSRSGPEFIENPATRSLGVGQSVPARDYVSPIQGKQAYETGEMVTSSVVEETTKLLKKER